MNSTGPRWVPLLRGEVEDELRASRARLAQYCDACEGEIVYTYTLFDTVRGMCMPRMHELDRVHVSAVLEHMMNIRGDDLLKGIIHTDVEACFQIMTEANEIADLCVLAAAKDKGYSVQDE